MDNDIEQLASSGGIGRILTFLVSLLQLVFGVVSIVVFGAILGAILNWWDWSDAGSVIKWVFELFAKEE